MKARRVNLPRLPLWFSATGLPLVLVCAFGWLSLGANGHAEAEALLGRRPSRVEFVIDEGAQLTHPDILRLPHERWRRDDTRHSLIARGGAVLWARITLRNATDVAQHGVLANDYGFTDRVECWTEDGGTWRMAASGESVREKAIAGRDIAFEIALPPRSERVIDVRVADRFTAALVPVWWASESEFHAAQARGWLGEGVYLGALLALLGYNALLWWRLRARDLGCYVLYLAFGVALMLQALLVPAALGWRWTSPAMDTALTVTLALVGFLLVRFARAFLQLAEKLPGWNTTVRGLGWLNVALAAGALALPWMHSVRWLGLTILVASATHVVLFAAGAAAWRAGVAQARFFAMSFGCLLAGGLWCTLCWWQRVPGDVGLHGLMIGSGLEMLLLSLAVADRFAQAQRDKALAQARLAEETERRRALQEAYADELEAEVRDRTRELEEANTDKDRMLSIIGHDLRSPLAGLMRAADDEPGTFARETAHTGRALLLLIEDLVLWARLRAGTRQIASHSARSLVAPAVALHRALAERGGTQLILTVPDELRVETDLVLAQTLVRNLLANALKFARTRVVLRAEPVAGSGARITVGNDGPPLPAAVAARFASGQNEPMTATGGLGLRLCREICAAFGTRLEAGAGTDGGTEFSFNLPVPAGSSLERS